MGSLWNRSGLVERYADDLRATGAKAYFFLGGTTTPMSVYQDSAESSAHSHPLLADSNGRWPDVFVPYITSYDVRVTTADNVQLTYSLEIPNPNPVDVTTTTPPEETVQTGMIHAEFVNTTKSGYVRLNGRTMGNAASGATERANADTSDLFTYLWNNLTDAIAPVSTGRGGSAAADYAANKTITLPNMRGKTFVGLDDMGNAAASAFTGLTFDSGNATTAGSAIGANSRTLITGNLPVHSHTGTTNTESGHTHSGTTSGVSADHTHSGTTGTEGAAHSHSGTTSAQNESLDHTHNYLQASRGGTAGGGVASTVASSQVTGGVNSGLGSTLPHTHNFSTGTESSVHTHSFTSGGASNDHTHTITTGAGTAH